MMIRWVEDPLVSSHFPKKGRSKKLGSNSGWLYLEAEPGPCSSIPTPLPFKKSEHFSLFSSD